MDSEPSLASSPASLHGQAQFNEGRLLNRIFAGAASGVCLEVGAFDGYTGSATYAFEQRGWTAILVEPLPEMAAPIQARRKGPFFNVAAGSADGEITFSRALHDPAVSSAANNPWQKELYTLRGEATEQVTVAQLTLDTILARAGVARLDFATIDVEGHELAVLQGWDLRRWQPRVLILEDNSRGLDRLVPAHLAACGYACFHRTGVNDWYAPRADLLVTVPARLRMGAWRRWRKLRHGLKAFTPSGLKSFARRRGWSDN
ncbi:MAG: FkbM family methyltransferase [Lacunisphaera sp.]